MSLRMHLRAIDRKILNYLQEDFPLVREPFKILSKRVGIKELELIKRIKNLKDKGIIRMIAASLTHNKLGFKSSLIGLRISEKEATKISAKIVKYPEVTHCYLREGDFNLWIVFMSRSRSKIKNFLAKLTERVGKENILNLATKKQFKLRTRLKV